MFVSRVNSFNHPMEQYRSSIMYISKHNLGISYLMIYLVGYLYFVGNRVVRTSAEDNSCWETDVSDEINVTHEKAKQNKAS